MITTFFDVTTGQFTLREVTPEEAATMQPPAPVVSAGLPNLEPYQFHAMVRLTGHDSDIRQAITSDPDPLFAAAALAKYEHSTYYKREDPFVVALAAAVGLTSEQLDTLWVNASEF